MTLKSEAYPVWHTFCISDKNGVKLFRETCTDSAAPGVLRMLNRKLTYIKDKHPAFKDLNIDPESAYVMHNGAPYTPIDQMSDDDLLNELMKD